MGEWLDIARWPECVNMTGPGIVFEIRNAEGQAVLTPCMVPLPAMPFDWKSPPLRFRAIAEPPAQHSRPAPEPRD